MPNDRGATELGRQAHASGMLLVIGGKVGGMTMPTAPAIDPNLLRAQFRAVLESMRKVILGKDDVIARVLWAVAAGGHVLFRDVPGVGKTVLAKAFAASVAADFKRIQFTPDLLPMDVSGANIFDMRQKTFTFQPGPIFTNVLLADEIKPRRRHNPRCSRSWRSARSRSKGRPTSFRRPSSRSPR